MSDTHPLDDIEPGDVPVAEPIDGVKLEFHGLADDSAGPMMINATVYQDDGSYRGTYFYDIVEIEEDDDGTEHFVAEADGQRNTKAENAIEEAGGVIKA